MNKIRMGLSGTHLFKALQTKTTRAIQLQMKVPFIANIWGLWHLQGTEYTAMSEWMSRMGLQKNWGK